MIVNVRQASTNIYYLIMGRASGSSNQIVEMEKSAHTLHNSCR